MKASIRQRAGLGQRTTKSVKCKTPIRFKGLPRHVRAISALMRMPVSRHALDGIAGASNSPALIAELRQMGLEIPCERINSIDRDGRSCRPGIYSLTESDRDLLLSWGWKE